MNRRPQRPERCALTWLRYTPTCKYYMIETEHSITHKKVTSMPYCPNCGSEYREGYTECKDCGITLVRRLPNGFIEPNIERGSTKDSQDDVKKRIKKLFQDWRARRREIMMKRATMNPDNVQNKDLVEGMNDEELLAEHNAVCRLIFGSHPYPSFRASDMAYFTLLSEELRKRGYKVRGVNGATI